MESFKSPYPIWKYLYVRFEQSCRNPHDENFLKKLIVISNPAKEIANKSGTRFRCLRKDTWNYLPQTCNRLVELLTYLSGTIHEYVILRDITSDPLKINLEN